MNDGKIKVKDLATQHNIPLKDFLHVLYELNIPAKASNSEIDAKELPKITAYLNSAASPKNVVQEQVNSNVKVRRRNKENANSNLEETGFESKNSDSTEQKFDEKTTSQKNKEEKPKAKNKGRQKINDTAHTARIIQRPDEFISTASSNLKGTSLINIQENISEPQTNLNTEINRFESANNLTNENTTNKQNSLTEPTNQSTFKQKKSIDLADSETDTQTNSLTIDQKSFAQQSEEINTNNEQKNLSSVPKSKEEENEIRPKRKKKKIKEEIQIPQVRIISRPEVNNAEIKTSGTDSQKIKTAETNHINTQTTKPRLGYGKKVVYDFSKDKQNKPTDKYNFKPEPEKNYKSGSKQHADYFTIPGTIIDHRSDKKQEKSPDSLDKFAHKTEIKTNFNPSSTKLFDGQHEKEDLGKKKSKHSSKRTVDFHQDILSDDDNFDLNDKNFDLNVDVWGMPSAQRVRRSRKSRNRENKKALSTQPIKAIKRKIKVDEFIMVSNLAHQMGIKGTEIIKALMQLGILATINQSLNLDTATLVASNFGYEVEKVGFSEEEYLTAVPTSSPENLKPRPPVVTIMGHVDHGKTSLLDAIRKSSVASREAGGITQHIGAYHVTTKRGEIVFLDTPGHEAFTAMRTRGAQVTDLVVLVVAADDGVMEQTREAVSHAKAAGVAIMVAVNKIDKEGANPDRVTRELSELGLVSEEWGGETIFSKVSAKTREGLDELLELIALQAEILELKADTTKPARGHVIEAKLDKGRGPLATILIQEGTLKSGDPFVCGTICGKVRAMFNDQGKKVKEASPSMPVEVQGFENVPNAGEAFIIVTDEKISRKIADDRAMRQREKVLVRESKVTLETFLASKPETKEALILNLVLKVDVHGSLEAITEAILKLSTDKIKVHITYSGTGAITESDILLASASNAIIIGFNVKPTIKVKELAEQEKVEIRFYDIIYKLVDEIKSAMKGMLAPVLKEVYLGQVEVRQTFTVPKAGTIAGCFVVDGKIMRNAGVRLLREGVVQYTGKITSLKHFKDDVKEIAKGYECGIGLENYNDIKIGDNIEAFETVEEAASL